MWQKIVCLMWLIVCCGAAHADVLLPQGKNMYFARSDGDAVSAWHIDTQTARARRVSPDDLQTPLGSTWKLFVYAYLVDNDIADVPYQCTGNNSEEKYCCQAGGSIGRDAALLQSCGLYFEPRRLGLQDASWRFYWYVHAAPLWLTELDNLKENTVLPVRNVLWGVQQIPDKPRQAAQNVLLNVWLRADFGNSFNALGSRLRGKTLTMPHPLYPRQRIGGMAGWLADGNAFWLLGRGNSHEVLRRSGPALAKLDLPSESAETSAACVEVDYLAFLTNPIVRVARQANGTSQTVYGGRLPRGNYTATLQNGRQVTLTSDDDLSVFADGAHYRIRARLALNEYVARVLEREAAATPEQAARALSIAIRSYALNEGSGGSGDCLYLRDSTRQMRVLPRPAQTAAKQIADATDGLVLHGAHGFFRDNIDTDDADNGRDVLGWQQAMAWDRQGLGFREILARAYPPAGIGVLGNEALATCTALPQAVEWLKHRLPRWQKTLRREAGYRTLDGEVGVCLITRGAPYADLAAQRVYVRGIRSENEQIALLHEYLHLVFASHPNGANEDYIENLARRLLKG